MISSLILAGSSEPAACAAQRDQDRAVVVVGREDRVDARLREGGGERVRDARRCRGGRGALDAFDDRGVALVDALVERRALHPVGRVDLHVLRPEVLGDHLLDDLAAVVVEPEDCDRVGALAGDLGDVGLEVGRLRVVGRRSTTTWAPPSVKRRLATTLPKPVP